MALFWARFSCSCQKLSCKSFTENFIKGYGMMQVRRWTDEPRLQKALKIMAEMRLFMHLSAEKRILCIQKGGGTVKRRLWCALGVLCILSGYILFPHAAAAQSYLLYESFGGPAPPGWLLVDGGNDGRSWMYSHSRPYWSEFLHGSCIVVDSQHNSSDEQLITPAIDLSGCSGSVYLEFCHVFSYDISGSSEVADVDISMDNGATWTNLLRMNSTSVASEVRTIDITSYAAGQSNVKIRFHYYNANEDYWWAIDNVRLFCTAGGETTDLLYEDFNSIPESWTTLSSSSPESFPWISVSASRYYITSPFSNNCAAVESNAAGAAVLNETLVTPSFNAGNCLGSIYLEFANCFTWYYYGQDEVGDVDVSVDGGPWTNILRMRGASYGPELKSLDITTRARGHADVKARFHYYNAKSEYWWLVDEVRVRSTQSRPTADAGQDRSASAGETVTLDGSGSFDPDQENITYLWTLMSVPSGSAAVLVNSASAQPYFSIDAAGDYVISLIVTDINGNSSLADEVVISTINSPPIANAGPDRTVHAGDSVTLDGTGSYDPDGDSFTYAWSMDAAPAGSEAALDDPSAATPVFVADMVGNYRISLVVTDASGSASVPDEVIIGTENSAPVADAGDAQTVHTGSMVTLDGSGSSDPDNDPITYAWSIVSAPTGSSAVLSDPAAVKPTFIADVSGDYVLSLTVTDSYGTVSAPDQVVVSTENSPPVADAGDDQTIHVGVLATLNGSGSDPDGDGIALAWQFTAIPQGSQAILINAETATPSFTPDIPGNYTLALIVTDEWGLASDPDTVTVSTTNTKPFADAGGDVPVTVIGTTVYLDGSQSYDPDGDAISFSWSIKSCPAGSTAALVNAISSAPYFVPDLYGDYIIELTVSDPWSSSDPDSMQVSFTNVKPVANAGNSQTVNAGDPVTLDGSGSFDANGDPITFLWTLTVPQGSQTAFLDDQTLATPSFTPDVAGIYTASLVVNDGYENSEPSAVTIEATQSSGELVTILQDAIASINAINDKCFRNRNMKKTLVNKLNAVLAKIDEGSYAEACNKLQHDILGKMNGCGSSPGKNDWIICCAAQLQVRDLIEQAMDILAGMM
ncbi:MAG: PKD domain-containing protein [Syntrophales bacterium]|nr:PKD domain-containing protein [Syntrophales bacterium]